MCSCLLSSKNGPVNVHAQDSKILDPWRHELPRRLDAGDLSKDEVHSIFDFIFKDIKFSKNENNQHSDIWLTEKQRNQNKFPDYIDESDYELLNEFKTHRGIWGNYPTEYYDYFRDHINSLISLLIILNKLQLLRETQNLHPLIVIVEILN